MNTSGTLELLGGVLLSQDLLGIELDRLNRNELDRVRYSIKISLTRSSEDQDSVNFWNTIMARGPDSIAGGEAPVRGATISKWFLDMIAEADKIREALVTSLPYVGGILKQNWELGIGKMPTVLGKSMMNNQPYINIPIPTPASSTYHPPPLPTTQYQPPQSQLTPTSTHWSGSQPFTSHPPADAAESKKEEKGGGGGGGKSGQRVERPRGQEGTVYQNSPSLPGLRSKRRLAQGWQRVSSSTEGLLVRQSGLGYDELGGIGDGQEGLSQRIHVCLRTP